ncbi:MAG: biotin synthase BioB [Planctomycetes bacterium]|nr:biotin synthase BioB [Planctomycetota bacterium]
MTTTARTKKSPTVAEVEALLARPLLELVFDAAKVHREHHDPARVQCSQLLSIKTGGCAEDCGYCSQSAHFDTAVKREPLMQVDAVLAAARAAKANGADRFCMGAAWREVKDGPDFDRVLAMVREVKSLGLETCVTLGMLRDEQATKLRDAGLDYYNHNLDTGKSHYGEIVHTRTQDDRLATLDAVRAAGIHVCSGGILGLGESQHARAELLHQLASLEPQPESVPINALVPIEGTPLANQAPLDWTEIVRAVAAARILMPTSVVRLSAGRTEMHEAAQALCFLAGANSIFVGDELLTTPNPKPATDAALFAKLGLLPVENSRAGSGAVAVENSRAATGAAAGENRRSESPHGHGGHSHEHTGACRHG